jgi:hypothetical protein
MAGATGVAMLLCGPQRGRLSRWTEFEHRIVYYVENVKDEPSLGLNRRWTKRQNTQIFLQVAANKGTNTRKTSVLDTKGRGSKCIKTG